MPCLAPTAQTPHLRARKGSPLRQVSVLLAFVAAMLLAIAGGPSVAQDAACDPCPPDCPMMLPDGAAVGVDHGAQAPTKPAGKAPCQQTVLCQPAPVVAPLPVSTPVTPVPTIRIAARWTNTPDAPSRPPDRNLRPPISL